MSEILMKATEFANKAYKDILSQGTNLPHILQAMEAANVTATMTDDREVIAAAVLYDVQLNPKIKIRKIRKKFGERIAWLVAAEQHGKKNNKKRKRMSVAQHRDELLTYLMATESLAAKAIAIGDCTAQLHSILRQKETVGEGIWARLDPDNKAEQEAFYRSVANATKDLSSFTAWREYNVLINRTFAAVAQLKAQN